MKIKTKKIQHLLNLVLEKVKKFEGPSYHGS